MTAPAAVPVVALDPQARVVVHGDRLHARATVPSDRNRGIASADIDASTPAAFHQVEAPAMLHVLPASSFPQQIAQVLAH